MTAGSGMTVNEQPDARPWAKVWAWLCSVAVDNFQVLVLLTALTFIAHELHWPPDFDATMLSKVSRMRSEKSQLAAMGDEPWIALLEFTAESRIGTLEYKGDLLPAEIARLGGVRPIDRTALALALEQLARRLNASPRPPAARCPPPGCRRPLVAIDIDVAPLESQPDASRMRNALSALRETADVVAITLSRSGEKGRQERFDFMRNGCTRRAMSPGRPGESSGAPGPVAAGSEPPDHALRGGLFFASSNLLADAGQPVYSYPFRRKRAAAPGAFTSPLFPSLGNLIYAHRCLSSADNAGCVLSPAEAAEALTAYCEAAHQEVATPSRFPEDEIVDQPRLAVEAIAHQYSTALMNSRLQNSLWLRESIVPSVPVSASAPRSAMLPSFDAVGAHLINSPVVLVSVDGGAGHDKHPTASGGLDPSTGALLHAVTALSGRQPLDPASKVSFLLDFGFGSIFVLLWAVVKPLPKLHIVKSLRLSLLAAVLLPLVIAMSLACGSLYVATVLLEWDRWFNPLLLIGGLLLHAYIGQTEAAPPAPTAPPAPPVPNAPLHHSCKHGHNLVDELSFGPLAAWKALRSPPWPDRVGTMGSCIVKWALLGFAIWLACRSDHH